MYTPLHAATASDQMSVVKLLLDLGADVDAVKVHGNTALHIACLNGQDMVLSELLSYTSQINALNCKGLVMIIIVYLQKLYYE